jgi:hypothetical protein
LTQSLMPIAGAHSGIQNDISLKTRVSHGRRSKGEFGYRQDGAPLA